MKNIYKIFILLAILVFPVISFAETTGKMTISNLTENSVTFNISSVSDNVKKISIFFLDLTDNTNWAGGENWSSSSSNTNLDTCCNVFPTNHSVTKNFNLKPGHFYAISGGMSCGE